MLTAAAVKAARPMAHAFKRWDAGGLYLLVVPTGRRSWMLRVRAGGRETLLTLGQWPELSLDAARARRDAARAAIAAGQDPRAALQIRTFEAAARAWHAHRTPGWTPVHAADVLASLDRDVFPSIGAMALDQVTAPTVLQLLRAVEARGAIETARRLRQRIKMICAFARGEGWMSADNPGNVKENLANAPARGRQPALVDLAAIRALIADVDQLAAAPVAKLGSRFLALTTVRLAALRGMTWSEVDQLDGPAPLWRVPAARMKLRAVNKLDAQRDHLVPLSTAAANALRAVREFAGGAPGPERLVFVGRDGDALIGEDALNQLYGRAGYAGRHCAHGWRAAFSTVMNERRPADRAAIDRALGHVVSGVSENEGAYNRAQHIELRREILEEWAAIVAPLDSSAV